MNRRGFLKGILLASIAPAFVPVERLMRIKPIVVPPKWTWKCVCGEIVIPSAEVERVAKLSREDAAREFLEACLKQHEEALRDTMESIKREMGLFA